MTKPLKDSGNCKAMTIIIIIIIIGMGPEIKNDSIELNVFSFLCWFVKAIKFSQKKSEFGRREIK